MSKSELSKMVSNEDFSKMLGNGVKIFKYSELEQYTDINQIIPEDHEYCIILIETKPQTGHWVCVQKLNDKSFIYFDSYGLAPDQEFNFIPIQMQQLLDEKIHIMSKLLNKLKTDGGTWNYNAMKLQKMQNGISTCGKWCASVCYFFQRGYNLKQFQDYFKNWKNKTNLNYDQLVCEFVKPFGI